MKTRRRVQIHQYNDSEILEYFNQNRVEYRLLGDHLFVIRCRGREVGAGPGDWLTIAADGGAEVQSGDYPRRVQQAIRQARASAAGADSA